MPLACVDISYSRSAVASNCWRAACGTESDPRQLRNPWTVNCGS